MHENDPAYTHVVRFHEVDPQSHVYHSRYLEIADAGFSDYLAGLLGLPYSAFEEEGFSPALVATEIAFHAPARYEDRLDVFVTPTKLGTSSFQMRIRVVRTPDRVDIATILTTYVNYDPEAERSRPVPAQFAARLRAALSTAERP